MNLGLATFAAHMSDNPLDDVSGANDPATRSTTSPTTWRSLPFSVATLAKSVGAFDENPTLWRAW